MKKNELEVFYLYDKLLYLVEENSILVKILDELDTRYSEKQVQDYINRLISWYMVKYSDTFLDSLFDVKKHTDTTILDIMNFETLQKNYSVFEEDLFQLSDNEEIKVILHKNLVIAAGWGLIYDKKSTPEYGFYRAKQLLNDFNSYFSWNLPADIYRDVLEGDYSLENEENRKLIEKHKHHKSKKHNKKKKRKHLFNW